jgi:hypothetical protein
MAAATFRCMPQHGLRARSVLCNQGKTRCTALTPGMRLELPTHAAPCSLFSWDVLRLTVGTQLRSLSFSMWCSKVVSYGTCVGWLLRALDVDNLHVRRHLPGSVL